MTLLDDLVLKHNNNRKVDKMGKMAYIVFDQSGDVFGVYEELTDAEDRTFELNEKHRHRYFIEEYTLNKDINPFD